MELLKVLILGIIISILAIFLKSIKPEYSFLCIIAGSIIILIYILKSSVEVFGFFDMVVEKTGINNELFYTMLKIIGVGYLVEFSANVCRDSGNSTIADKIILAGKVMIFIVSMPIISNLFNLVLGML
jgi:stage III sporulation protein AD